MRRDSPVDGLGAVGVGAPQPDLAVPQGGEVDGDGRRHAQQHDVAAGPDDGQGLVDASLALPTQSMTTSTPPDRPAPTCSERVARRTARRVSPGSTTTSAPSSRAQLPLLGVLGRGDEGAGRGEAAEGGDGAQAEGARAQHEHGGRRSTPEPTAAWTAQAAGSTITAASSLMSSGTRWSWLSWATIAVDQPPPVSAQ